MDLRDISNWCRLCGHLEGTLKVRDELEHQVEEVFHVSLMKFHFFQFVYVLIIIYLASDSRIVDLLRLFELHRRCHRFQDESKHDPVDVHRDRKIPDRK